MRALILALALASAALAQYFPPSVNGGTITVTGGPLTFAVPDGATTLSILGGGSPSAVLGGSNFTVANCVPRRSADYTITCDAGFTWNGSGSVILTNSSAPIMTLKNSGATQSAVFEWQNASGRQWLFGTGLPSTSNTGLAYAEYTNGSFIGIPFYLKKAGTVCVGFNNAECTGNTLTVKNGTASTGATRVGVELGAADSATTVTVTNAGTTKSAGYQSSDGTAGITGTTCVAASMQVKNGLVVAGCS